MASQNQVGLRDNEFGLISWSSNNAVTDTIGVAQAPVDFSEGAAVYTAAGKVNRARVASFSISDTNKNLITVNEGGLYRVSVWVNGSSASAGNLVVVGGWKNTVAAGSRVLFAKGEAAATNKFFDLSRTTYVSCNPGDTFQLSLSSATDATLDILSVGILVEKV